MSNHCNDLLFSVFTNNRSCINAALLVSPLLLAEDNDLKVLRGCDPQYGVPQART